MLFLSGATMPNREGDSAWELFITPILISTGIGVLFNAIGVGVLIGVGLGFITSSLVKRTGRRYVVVIPENTFSIIVVLVGLSFITGGLYMLGIATQEKVYQYITAAMIISIGLIIAFTSLKPKARKQSYT